jgi:hypothetical protein
MRINWIKNPKTLAVIATMVLVACAPERSPVTGWAYNDPTNGGFEKPPYEEQETGPGLVLIEGGSFTMGRTEQDVTYEWNNNGRKVTVSSFYMDETEVSWPITRLLLSITCAIPLTVTIRLWALTGFRQMIFAPGVPIA